MKKKILTMLFVLTVGAGVMTGCSGETKNEGGSSSAEQNGEEASEVQGTIEEIKDYMFIVNGSDGVSYAFTFEEKPEGLEEVKVGEKVVVRYTGTISEIDPFKGEVLSVEKL